MSAIVIRNFGGVIPRTQPRYLPDTNAQVAINCPAWLGSLVGISGTTKVMNTVRTAPQTIYRFGQDIDSATQYWFEFPNDVDVVRGAIAGDAEERTFFTDGVKPKKTNATLALTGAAPYPVNSYDMGVPAPSGSVIATPTAGTYSGIAETRLYLTTFVTSWGDESAPSTESNPKEVYPDQSVVLSAFPALPAGNHNITHRRIYRTATGSSTTEYLFVATIPVATATFTDDLLAEELGEVLPSLTWTAPPDKLHGLVGMPNGILAGFVGRDVYFCDPYHPFAWPEGYVQTVDYPVVGLGVMDTTLAVLTTGVPYFIQGTHPDSMAMLESDIRQACVSKRSIVSMAGVVFFASPDGLVMLSSGGSGLATEQMFTREQWQALNPSTIHAYQWEGKYVAFYSGGGFVFDPASKAFVMHNIVATAGFNDLLRDTLYLVIGNEIHTWFSGTPKTYTWRSKKFSLPRPTALACAQVEAEAYPVTFKYYADGVLKLTKTVSSRDVFRLPSGFLCSDMEFEVSGTPEVFLVGVAQSPKELANG